MVQGESRYFTLSPIGGGSLAGYSANYKIERIGGNTTIKQGSLNIVDNKIDVKIQTNDIAKGTYNLNIFIVANDGFVQVYNEVMDLK